MVGVQCSSSTATSFILPPPSEADLDFSGKCELIGQGELRASGDIGSFNGLLKNYYVFSINKSTLSFCANNVWYKEPTLPPPPLPTPGPCKRTHSKNTLPCVAPVDILIPLIETTLIHDTPFSGQLPLDFLANPWYRPSLISVVLYCDPSDWTCDTPPPNTRTHTHTHHPGPHWILW